MYGTYVGILLEPAIIALNRRAWRDADGTPFEPFLNIAIGLAIFCLFLHASMIHILQTLPARDYNRPFSDDESFFVEVIFGEHDYYYAHDPDPDKTQVWNYHPRRLERCCDICGYCSSSNGQESRCQADFAAILCCCVCPPIGIYMLWRADQRGSANKSCNCFGLRDFVWTRSWIPMMTNIRFFTQITPLIYWGSPDNQVAAVGITFALTLFPVVKFLLVNMSQGGFRWWFVGPYGDRERFEGLTHAALKIYEDEELELYLPALMNRVYFRPFVRVYFEDCAHWEKNGKALATGWSRPFQVFMDERMVNLLQFLSILAPFIIASYSLALTNFESAPSTGWNQFFGSLGLLVGALAALLLVISFLHPYFGYFVARIFFCIYRKEGEEYEHELYRRMINDAVGKDFFFDGYTNLTMDEALKKSGLPKAKLTYEKAVRLYWKERPRTQNVTTLGAPLAGYPPTDFSKSSASFGSPPGLYSDGSPSIYGQSASTLHLDVLSRSPSANNPWSGSVGYEMQPAAGTTMYR